MSNPQLGSARVVQAHLVLESASSPGSSCIGQDCRMSPPHSRAMIGSRLIDGIAVGAISLGSSGFQDGRSGLRCRMNMSPDGPPSATVIPSSQRVLSIPRTSLGKWSMWLLAAFALLMCLFLAVLPSVGKVKGHYVSLWLPLISSAVSAVAAGIAALMAILRRAERSIFMLLPLLAGVLVLLWTIGEMTE